MFRTCVEVCPPALQAASQFPEANAMINGLESKVMVQQGDLYSALNDRTPSDFDLIVPQQALALWVEL